MWKRDSEGEVRCFALSSPLRCSSSNSSRRRSKRLDIRSQRLTSANREAGSCCRAVTTQSQDLRFRRTDNKTSKMHRLTSNPLNLPLVQPHPEDSDAKFRDAREEMGGRRDKENEQEGVGKQRGMKEAGGRRAEGNSLLFLPCLSSLLFLPCLPPPPPISRSNFCRPTLFLTR